MRKRPFLVNRVILCAEIVMLLRKRNTKFGKQLNSNAMNRDDRKFHKDERSDRGDLPGKLMDPDDMDSKVNTDFKQKPKGESLTNDESADTDPNEVPNKPGFRKSDV